MKRIKRIISISLVILLICVLTACKKEYSSITYKRFVEKMGDGLNYSVKDNTLVYQDVFQRNYTAIKENVIITFYEFETEDEAKDYLKKNYDKEKYYRYKSYDGYSTVKYNKSGYLYMIQVDNIIISGYSDDNTDKYEIKNVFSELGY